MDDIASKNPYEGNAQLSPLEQDVLWEYAKLNKNVKDLCARLRELSEGPDKDLLVQLRVLERKMGLVMTLFKASWWGHISSVQEAASDPGEDTFADQTITR
ncbi:hypothetical protein EXIGLDRAFT_622935 [Exidia glandulosa HHB12029]|uniref:DASH complex subunit DAD3 n=1 Tax=Exidia glandulosa HHB12029 TaxID=1314781 RepID=A0A165ZSM5_EXIGL|nr:hypothetical protein EXIGLDRAFT_622935 [Exidia glandulosa HHB12029]